jgi:hypothetical protein
MIRLTGLPAVGRYPRASVSRDESNVSVVFSGAEGSSRIDVPLARLGEEEDPESVELRLSGDLQRMGYRVERLPPAPT